MRCIMPRSKYPPKAAKKKPMKEMKDEEHMMPEKHKAMKKKGM